jgi:hypothetical protein
VALLVIKEAVEFHIEGQKSLASWVAHYTWGGKTDDDK